jgi:hypothetical protein
MLPATLAGARKTLSGASCASQRSASRSAEYGHDGSHQKMILRAKCLRDEILHSSGHSDSQSQLIRAIRRLHWPAAPRPLAANRTVP